MTIESIGKDQASLEKAGKRMSGNDVVIAPNILEEMAGPRRQIEKAAALGPGLLCLTGLGGGTVCQRPKTRLNNTAN